MRLPRGQNPQSVGGSGSDLSKGETACPDENQFDPAAQPVHNADLARLGCRKKW
jgi:hypothetical protein